MGYIPTNWKDHIFSDNRYRINQNSDGTVSITPAGKVVQQGTPMSAENFNHMEEGIKSASELSDSAKKLETARKINGVSFDGTQDITIDVTGKTRRYELGPYDSISRYSTFARTSNINTLENCGATLLVTDAGNFGSPRRAHG